VRGTGNGPARAYAARTVFVMVPDVLLRPRMLGAEYREALRNVKHVCLRLSGAATAQRHRTQRTPSNRSCDWVTGTRLGDRWTVVAGAGTP